LVQTVVHCAKVRRLVATVRFMEQGSVTKGKHKKPSNLMRLRGKKLVGNERAIVLVQVYILEFFW